MTLRNLSMRLGVSSIGISKSLSALRKKGSISQERVGNGGRGRPEHAVSLSANAGFALGIVIRSSEVQLALVDFRNVVRASSRIDFSITQSSTDFLPIFSEIRRLMAVIENCTLDAIGFSISGDFDYKTGRILKVNDFTSPDQAGKFRTALTRKYRVPVAIVHDTDAQMIAERWCNYGLPENPNLLFVGERLGFSLMLDGRLVCGKANWKRWLGDLQVPSSTIKGLGFLPGALAATASISSWIDRRNHVAFGKRSNWKSDDYEISFRELARLHQENDTEARKFVRQSGHDLGQIIRGLCLLLPFDRVILNGWPPTLMDKMLESVNASVSEGAALLQGREIETAFPPVSVAVLGDQTEVTGSALWAIDQLLYSQMARRGRQEFHKAPVAEA
jgi:predicted NBD/HSP70 family sugar kinase